ncbi:uncharacterized protein LOC123412923 [Hordeum vulgare subsp. vulgare]|uniref:uncharacterized protein LOC123412923 n=1 Tax=Hordeum vulgare subsp. vulgare TaxID=112509 RepID=UPI001D1A3EFC|nr:uncharacterized protein LOC123412923 [Hordeum vulgare subsp. vulgare]
MAIFFLGSFCARGARREFLFRAVFWEGSLQGCFRRRGIKRHGSRRKKGGGKKKFKGLEQFNTVFSVQRRQTDRRSEGSRMDGCMEKDIHLLLEFGVESHG